MSVLITPAAIAATKMLTSSKSIHFAIARIQGPTTLKNVR